MTMSRGFLLTALCSGSAGGIGAGSLYLHDGVGMSSENDVLRQYVAAFLKAWGRPFIIGGDMNMDPYTMRASGWP